MADTVLLIIPCYNEANRLDLSTIQGGQAGCRFLFVDDGSTDGTAELIRRGLSQTVNLLVLPRNRGKGEAVRQGMLHAKQAGFLQDIDWVGYWDADMATPLDELDPMVTYAVATLGERVDGILGSRIYKLGSRITRSFVRHLAGRAFATLSSTLLNLDAYDSQCGAKLFRPRLVDDAFGEPFVSRWIFDVEILLRLRNRHLVEYPLRRWVDVTGSKARVVPLLMPTLIDLLRIWRRYRTR